MFFWGFSFLLNFYLPFLFLFVSVPILLLPFPAFFFLLTAFPLFLSDFLLYLHHLFFYFAEFPFTFYMCKLLKMFVFFFFPQISGASISSSDHSPICYSCVHRYTSKLCVYDGSLACVYQPADMVHSPMQCPNSVV